MREGERESKKEIDRNRGRKRARKNQEREREREREREKKKIEREGMRKSKRKRETGRKRKRERLLGIDLNARILRQIRARAPGRISQKVSLLPDLLYTLAIEPTFQKFLYLQMHFLIGRQHLIIWHNVC